MAELTGEPDVWRFWLLFDPRRVMVAVFVFLIVLGAADPLHLLSAAASTGWKAPALRGTACTAAVAGCRPRRSSSATVHGGGRGGRVPGLVRGQRCCKEQLARLHRSGGADKWQCSALRKNIVCAGDSDRGRSVRLLGGALFRRLLRSHSGRLRSPRHCADLLRSCDQSALECLADQHRAARHQLRAGVRAAGGRRLWQLITICAIGAFISWALGRSRSAASSASACMCRLPSASRSSPTSLWS